MKKQGLYAATGNSTAPLPQLACPTRNALAPARWALAQPLIKSSRISVIEWVNPEKASQEPQNTKF
jgi:hypothetical protein